MFELKEKAILNEKIAELEMNLSNNYKDLAITAYKEFGQLLDSLKLKEKTYNKYKKIYDEYSAKMEGYSHRDFYHSK
ncbi:MAG: hypothetical protein IKS17_09750 [Firmicutes bacterium]|nr:hypothetical protein [Bacillota bacterium]